MEKTKYFSACHPNRLLHLLHEKEKEIKKQEEEIRKSIPTLIQKYELDKKSNETTLFKGLKGMQTAIFELLDSVDSEIYAMGITTSKDTHFNLLWDKWHKERERKKIKCKCLFSDISKEYSVKLKNMKHIDIRIIKGITPSAITISGDVVLIQTYQDDIECMLIRNPNIAKSFKTFFETMWEQAK